MGQGENNKGKKGKGLVKELVPCTWTTGWGLTVGAEGGLGRGSKGEKIGTAIIEQW